MCLLAARRFPCLVMISDSGFFFQFKLVVALAAKVFVCVSSGRESAPKDEAFARLACMQRFVVKDALKRRLHRGPHSQPW